MKIVIALLTIAIGILYSRKEIETLINYVREKEYIELDELRSIYFKKSKGLAC
jgi:hypothetical protein